MNAAINRSVASSRVVRRFPRGRITILATLLAVMLMAIPATWRATTGGASAATVGESFFGTTVPTNLADDEAVAVELGLRFRTGVAGSVTAIRFYKGPSNTGTHIGSLWDSSGRKIASVVFTNETASGWQQANLPVAAKLAAGGSYVVSYLAPDGHYAADERAFRTGVSTTSLYAYSNRQGKNGVFRYGAGFPTSSYHATNYYVDLVFVPDGGSDTSTTPAPTTPAPTTPAPTTPAPTTPAPTTPAPTTEPPSGGGCPAGQVGVPPDCLPVPPSPLPAGKTWTINFHDEFDGTTLNTSNWSPCFDWNYGACTNSFNTGKEHYDPAQVRVSNGTAKLVAEPLSPPLVNSSCYNASCTYKAGLISTARPNAENGSAYLRPFTYGYIESRMKYPSISGMFTAFWMLPTSPNYSYRSEIDIVEILGGDPDTIFMTYHYNNRGSSYNVNNGDNNNGACAVRDYSQDWVRFGLDWQPAYVAWYIDGVKCGQFNGNTTTIENGPMQLVLHMMVDNQWERDWGLVLANQSTVATLEVDYVRVFQQQ